MKLTITPNKHAADSISYEWTLNGFLHREDGPAMIVQFNRGGTWLKWFRFGQRHREDGPAAKTIHADGTVGNQCWYINGIRHNLSGGPTVILTYCTGEVYKKEWHVAGQLHRENGPAVVYLPSNSKKWYKNGKLHREDGPAVHYNNEKGKKRFFIEGIEYSRYDFNMRQFMKECRKND